MKAASIYALIALAIALDVIAAVIQQRHHKPYGNVKRFGPESRNPFSKRRHIYEPHLFGHRFVHPPSHQNVHGGGAVRHHVQHHEAVDHSNEHEEIRPKRSSVFHRNGGLAQYLPNLHESKREFDGSSHHVENSLEPVLMNKHILKNILASLAKERQQDLQLDSPNIDSYTGGIYRPVDISEADEAFKEHWHEKVKKNHESPYDLGDEMIPPSLQSDYNYKTPEQEVKFREILAEILARKLVEMANDGSLDYYYSAVTSDQTKRKRESDPWFPAFEKHELKRELINSLDDYQDDGATDEAEETEDGGESLADFLENERAYKNNQADNGSEEEGKDGAPVNTDEPIGPIIKRRDVSASKTPHSNLASHNELKKIFETEDNKVKKRSPAKVAEVKKEAKTVVAPAATMKRKKRSLPMIPRRHLRDVKWDDYFGYDRRRKRQDTSVKEESHKGTKEQEMHDWLINNYFKYMAAAMSSRK